MKLDEAIELLGYHHVGMFSVSEVEFREAEQLGIEALKHILELRRYHNVLPDYLLPGETKVK